MPRTAIKCAPQLVRDAGSFGFLLLLLRSHSFNPPRP
jgi:hypothetical protein